MNTFQKGMLVVTAIVVFGILLSGCGKAESVNGKDVSGGNAESANGKDVNGGNAESANGKDVSGDKAEPVIGRNYTVADWEMEFVWIPQMNLHVGKYEVTNGEYRKMKPDHDSKAFAGHSLNGDRQPVVYVNFDDATAYAAWLTERERKAGRLEANWQYRLPTEAEWQAFAQCGDGREYPWGNEWPPKYGNYHGQEGAVPWGKISGYNDGFPVACPVEKSGKNDWGLYGVGGNVWEVTANPSGGFGAWLGASWYCCRPRYLRVGRYVYFGSRRGNNGGFRLILVSR